MATSGRTVAIIGGGPSGLAACKVALEEGLLPTVFERAAGIGGLWRSDASGKVWNSLKTNLSKWTCAFSDTPWPASAPEFPESAQLQQYLVAYAAEHKLFDRVLLRSLVKSLEPLPNDNGWRVLWEKHTDQNNEPTTESQTFDYAIVATGIFEVPHFKTIPGVDCFCGELVHAAQYRNPEQFAGRRVLVVGAAFSGAEIAADLVGVAESLTIATRRPLWYIPRYIGGKPADLAFYSRAAADKGRNASEEERNLKRHTFFASLVGTLPDKVTSPNPKAGDLPFVTITDTFLDAVKSGKVNVISSELVKLAGSAAVFSDGSQEDFDVVITATGYRLELPFLSNDVRETIEHDSQDLLQPVILHECVWHPKLVGLAFVGLYRGPYFASIELQARWACGVFSGRLKPPTVEEADAGLEVERSVRNQKPRPQFPHGDYVGMAESLAHRVGVHPSKILSDDSNPLKQILYDGPLLPFHYRLVGKGAAPAIAEAAIRECIEKYPIACNS